MQPKEKKHKRKKHEERVWPNAVVNKWQQRCHWKAGYWKTGYRQSFLRTHMNFQSLFCWMLAFTDFSCPLVQWLLWRILAFTELRVDLCDCLFAQHLLENSCVRTHMIPWSLFCWILALTEFRADLCRLLSHCSVGKGLSPSFTGTDTSSLHRYLKYNGLSPSFTGTGTSSLHKYPRYSSLCPLFTGPDTSSLHGHLKYRGLSPSFTTTNAPPCTVAWYFVADSSHDPLP